MRDESDNDTDQIKTKRDIGYELALYQAVQVGERKEFKIELMFSIFQNGC